VTAADRALLRAELAAAEAKARTLREELGAEAPERRRHERRPTLPKARPEDAGGATDIVEAKLLRDIRGKGMIER
jgi:hypothetical protein